MSNMCDVFDNLVVHSTFVVGATVGVSKINQLKILVIIFFPLAMLIFNEEVNLL
jgi:hypothetical protein